MKLAAIDIGSNAIRLMIANAFTDRDSINYKKETLIRIPIRLGEESFLDGKISSAKSEGLVKTMRAFGLLMDVFQVESYRACATSAMRDASNGPALIKQVEEEASIKIEIISGLEESEIIFKGLSSYFSEHREQAFLSIDVGGGSTETVLFQNGKINESYSWNIGTLRLLNDRVEESDWAEMKVWLHKLAEKYPNIQGLGSGGNINKVRKMYLTGSKSELTPTFLGEIHDHLSSYTYAERIKLLGLKPDRADVIVPAVEIFRNAMTWGGVENLYVPNLGLADGIIRDLFVRNN